MNIPIQPREWDFGGSQAKVKAENGQLSWKSFGGGGSSYPIRSISGVQYETAGCLSWMGSFVILVPGGDNARVQVPKTQKSLDIIASINTYIENFHQNQPNAAASAQPSTSVADELSKLATLKQQGILTEQEFQQQKSRLLAN